MKRKILTKPQDKRPIFQTGSNFWLIGLLFIQLMGGTYGLAGEPPTTSSHGYPSDLGPHSPHSPHSIEMKDLKAMEENGDEGGCAPFVMADAEPPRFNNDLERGQNPSQERRCFPRLGCGNPCAGVELERLKESAIQAGKVIGCLVVAGGLGYACYLSSAKANVYWNDIHSAAGVPQAISNQFRSVCRSSLVWQKACLQTDPIACQNSDYYQVGVNPYDIISWNVGWCGDIQGFQDDEYEEVWECRTVCTTNSKGETTCLPDCYWVTYHIGSASLNYLIPKCPNYPDYQNFLLSPEYRRCDQVVRGETPQARGYTSAAVFSALGAAGATGAAAAAAVGAW